MLNPFSSLVDDFKKNVLPKKENTSKDTDKKDTTKKDNNQQNATSIQAATGIQATTSTAKLKISEDNINSDGRDDTEVLIDKLQNAKLELIRELHEIFGINLGDTKANIAIQNYSIENPLQINGGAGMFGGLIGGAVGESGLSAGMFSYIYKIEAGIEYGQPYPPKLLNGYDLGDAKGHKTYGAGLLYHPTAGKYMDEVKQVWTQQELDGLFIQTVSKNVSRVTSWAQNAGIQLNQNQIDAIVSGVYNFGPGFLNKQVCNMIKQNPNNPEIKNVWAHMSDAQGVKYPGLIKRRNLEANWYFGVQT